MHPVFANELAVPSARAAPDFARSLGLLLARFLSTRMVMLEQPRLAPYYQPPPVVPEAAAGVPDSLPWTMTIPPYRTGDRLFTIVRDPEAIILSQVNAIVHALREPAAEDTLIVKRWRHRLGALPEGADADAWAAVARRLLARFPDRDPICHALGGGTLEGALEACAVTNIEIADLSRYDEWIGRTWDTKPPPAALAPPAALPREALNAADRDRLAALTAQDRPLYTKIRAALDGAYLASIKGSQLAA
jgi:hypothetical protein